MIIGMPVALRLEYVAYTRHWLASRDRKYTLITRLYVQGLATLPEPWLLTAMSMEMQLDMRGVACWSTNHTSPTP